MGQNEECSGIGLLQYSHLEANLTNFGISSCFCSFHCFDRLLRGKRKNAKKIRAIDAKTNIMKGVETSPMKTNGKMKKNPDPSVEEDKAIMKNPMNAISMPKRMSRSDPRNSNPTQTD